MKQCSFCHEMIEESETLCPFCGTVQDAPHNETISEQTTLFDEVNIASENRSEQDYRIKNQAPNYNKNIWRKIRSFFRFFAEKLIHPTNHFSRKRQISRTYGYIHIILSTLLAAFVTTYAFQSLLAQYQLLADISILPSLTSTPNYIVTFLKLLIFYLVFYLGFPTISYGIKHVFLKRQHVFHYWLTQYTGMNALAFLLLLLTGFMTFIAPIALLVVILFFFALHLLLYLITFVIAITQEQNDTQIDSPYLVLIGLAVQLMMTMSMLFILF